MLACEINTCRSSKYTERQPTTNSDGGNVRTLSFFDLWGSSHRANICSSTHISSFHPFSFNWWFDLMKNNDWQLTLLAAESDGRCGRESKTQSLLHTLRLRMTSYIKAGSFGFIFGQWHTNTLLSGHFSAQLRTNPFTRYLVNWCTSPVGGDIAVITDMPHSTVSVIWRQWNEKFIRLSKQTMFRHAKCCHYFFFVQVCSLQKTKWPCGN